MEQANTPSSSILNIDIRDLMREAGQIDNRVASRSAIATHFYLLQTVPQAAALVWDDAHHGKRIFDRDDDAAKRLIFETMTFTHYHAIIRAVVHKAAVEQWRADNSTPEDFIDMADLLLKLFFEEEGMSRVTDIEDVAQSDGWLDATTTLDFDRRIKSYLQGGSPEKADGYFIGYLEPALGCDPLSPIQKIEYRKLFHLIAAGVEHIIDPVPRDVLMLPLSIGRELTGPEFVEAVTSMFASEKARANTQPIA